MNKLKWLTSLLSIYVVFEKFIYKYKMQCVQNIKLLVSCIPDAEIIHRFLYAAAPTAAAKSYNEKYEKETKW